MPFPIAALPLILRGAMTGARELLGIADRGEQLLERASAGETINQMEIDELVEQYDAALTRNVESKEGLDEVRARSGSAHSRVADETRAVKDVFARIRELRRQQRSETIE